MTAASLALQQAIYGALTSSAPLIAATTGVFDAPKLDQPFPFVVIGEDIISDYSTKDLVASEHRLAIHIWSRSPGRAEAKQLSSLVQTALTSPLALTGFRLISLRFTLARMLVDPDGLTHQAIVEYRARLVAQ